MKKKTLPFLALLASAMMFGQTYDNGPLSTGATSSNGTAAPAGYTWSEIQHALGMSSLGAAGVTSAGDQFSLADDFVVPAGEEWTLTNADFFGYQTNSTSQPFDQCHVRIYDNNPATNGAVIYGDLTTNTMSSAVDSKMYRAAASAATNRKIWQIKNSINKVLTAGTYWINVNAHTANDGPGFFPAVTIVGSTGPSDANAVQEGSGSWTNLIDTGSSAPLALPFILTYTVQTMGVTETRQYDSRIVAYPNPTTSTFKMTLPENAKVGVVELYDMSGKLVKSFKQSDSYDISNLEKGVYLIKIKDGDVIKATRVIKK